MKESESASIGVTGLLGVAFIVLKIIGKIDWAWKWVLAPLWIPFALGLFLLVFALTMHLLTNKPTRHRFR